ncbi:MAG: hypothetical protein NZT92_10855 [Abditibacteriales bacterium]|nr:hypothetical protein [Abditibacteriales bacterium]MDW8366443.1 hypothetical protein [Abditibacteriales bacterium]
MKLLTIIYDSGIDESLTETLEEVGVSDYTKLFDAHGVGGRGKKFNTPVFPGTNNLLLVVVPDSAVNRITRAIAELQASFRLKPGIMVLVQDVTVADLSI